jgi:hypothetical protein
MVTYQAPQTKYWRNIMIDRRRRIEEDMISSFWGQLDVAVLRVSGAYFKRRILMFLNATVSP